MFCHARTVIYYLLHMLCVWVCVELICLFSFMKKNQNGFIVWTRCNRIDYTQYAVTSQFLLCLLIFSFCRATYCSK